MTNDVQHTPSIAIIAYEGVQMSAVLGLSDLFAVANDMSRGSDAAQLECHILRPGALSADERFAVVIVPPNLSDVRGSDDQDLHAWLGVQHRAGAVLCSACAGAFWLGHAGVLDGRPVTTHWTLAELFEQKFPAARLCPEHLLIDDHDIVTAGGVMAWIDLGLHVIKLYQGAEVVTKTCRHMLIDPAGRAQEEYRSFRPHLTHKDDAVRQVQLWIEAHPDSELTLAALAGQVAMSQRSLQRRFTEATGLPVNRYVQQVRIEKAKGLLERTSLSAAEISWSVGYKDLSSFCRTFKSICGLSTGEYRRRFSVQ